MNDFTGLGDFEIWIVQDLEQTVLALVRWWEILLATPHKQRNQTILRNAVQIWIKEKLQGCGYLKG